MRSCLEFLSFGIGSLAGFLNPQCFGCCLTSKLTSLPAYGAVVASARTVTEARLLVQRIVRLHVRGA